MRRLFVCVAVIAAMAACLGGTEPLPLDISVQLPASANTTDSISIVVNAQGSTMIGIETAFGDGHTQSLATGGARTAKVTFRHRYAQSGTYDVTATVTDAVLGTKAASVQLNVQ